MRANRQKTYHRPTFNQTKIVSQPQNQYCSQRNKPLYPKNSTFLLIDLIQQSNNQELTLNCHGKLSVKRHKNQLKHKKWQHKYDDYHEKYKQYRYINLQNRSQNIMKKCFDSFNQKITVQYIFTSHLQIDDGKKYPISNKNNILMNNTNLNKNKNRIKSSSNSLEKNRNYSSNYNNKSKQKHENSKQITSKYINKKYSSQVPQMFTVEQIIGESIQQDPHETINHIKTFLPIKNKPKSSQISHDNHIFINKNYNNRENHQNHIQNHINQFSEQNKSYKQRQIITKTEINYFQNTKNIEKLDNNKQNQLFNSIQLRNSSQICKEITPIQRFSFAKEIKQGIIEHEPFKNHKWQSFKLISDDQLQIQKKKCKDILQMPPMSQMNQLSQISSIVSNNIKEQTNKKHFQSQLDSIKLDLQNYNTTCMNINAKKQATQLQQASSCKVQQMKYKIDQGEQDINDLVEITKKQNENKTNEYYVKYNLRFLQNDIKSKAQVIRISPLKFRKKQQVVKHFMQTNIIQKQSSSINIP